MTHSIKGRVLFRKLNIVCSILSIIIILIDYYIVDEFNMEGLFVVCAIIGMVLNIYRIMSNSVFRIVWLRYYLDMILVVFLLGCLGMCALFTFGNGFSGGSNPFILDVTIVAIITFGLTLYIGIIQEVLHRKKTSPPKVAFLPDDTLWNEIKDEEKRKRNRIIENTQKK